MLIDVNVSLHQCQDGRWSGLATLPVGGGVAVRASGSTRGRCLAAMRRAIGRAVEGSPGGSKGIVIELVVESVPVLAGVAEAAQVMGWDKRRVITYIDRGRFPRPIQSLASGRVWIRADIEQFAREWNARRRERIARRDPRTGRGEAGT